MFIPCAFGTIVRKTGLTTNAAHAAAQAGYACRQVQIFIMSLAILLCVVGILQTFVACMCGMLSAGEGSLGSTAALFGG